MIPGVIAVAVVGRADRLAGEAAASWRPAVRPGSPAPVPPAAAILAGTLLVAALLAAALFAATARCAARRRLRPDEERILAELDATWEPGYADRVAALLRPDADVDLPPS